MHRKSVPHLLVIKDMAEVTWRATLIGALMLFLIGLVVATCLNYTQASLRSIMVGLNGPFSCQVEEQLRQTKLCNDSGELSIQDCVYIFVSYTDEKKGKTISNIKLAYSYSENDTYNYEEGIYGEVCTHIHNQTYYFEYTSHLEYRFQRNWVDVNDITNT